MKNQSFFQCINKMPLSDWQNHLNKYRERHPELNLKECMQGASKTYKGTSSSSSTDRPKSVSTTDKNTKILLRDVIGFSKAISHVSTSLDRNEMKKLQQIADQLQQIHDNHYQEDSQSESDSCSDSHSDVS